MTSIDSMVDPNSSFMVSLILGGIMTQEEVVDIIQNSEGTMEERSARLMEKMNCLIISSIRFILTMTENSRSC